MTEIELLQDQLTAVRVANGAEADLDRHVAAMESIAHLVGADDIALGSPFGLIKLIAKVGVLARVTANDSQAWDVLCKHVTANHKLAKLVHSLNEKVRYLEADRQALSERVLDLEGDLETATTAYSDLRARLMPSPSAEDVDANGGPVVGLELEASHD